MSIKVTCMTEGLDSLELSIESWLERPKNLPTRMVLSTLLAWIATRSRISP